MRTNNAVHMHHDTHLTHQQSKLAAAKTHLCLLDGLPDAIEILIAFLHVQRMPAKALEALHGVFRERDLCFAVN